VDSVFSQRRLPDELIIIDDASQDGTEEFCRSLTSRDFVIIYRYHDRARGGAFSRNEGVQYASGEYIAFLDDDDFWHTDKLCVQERAAQRYPGAGLFYTGVRVIDENQHLRRKVFHFAPPFQHFFIFLYSFPGITSALMVKKHILPVPCFDPALPALQEYDLFIRLLEKGYRAVGIRSFLVYYLHSASTTGVSASAPGFIAAAQMVVSKQGNFLKKMLQTAGLLRIGVQKCIFSKRFRHDFVSVLRKKNAGST
jgi:glycosyltransferase involved in cell wall biosynthesis